MFILLPLASFCLVLEYLLGILALPRVLLPPQSPPQLLYPTAHTTVDTGTNLHAQHFRVSEHHLILTEGESVMIPTTHQVDEEMESQIDQSCHWPLPLVQSLIPQTFF